MWCNINDLMRELQRFPDPKTTPYWICPEIFPYVFKSGDPNFEYLYPLGEAFMDSWKWGKGKQFAWTSGGC